MTLAARSWTALLLLWLSSSVAMAADAAASAPASAADPAQGQLISNGVCAACHANNGTRGVPIYPNLQGQHPEYLVKQLTEFKSGLRVNPIMMAYASALTPDDMRNLAAFYAAKHAAPGVARSKALADAGARIYRGGIADRSVPACAGCHSPTGAGIPSQYPRLAGQNADYTVAQLTAFKTGARKNSAPMMAIAAKLSEQEIKALAEYTAGLP